MIHLFEYQIDIFLYRKNNHIATIKLYFALTKRSFLSVYHENLFLMYLKQLLASIYMSIQMLFYWKFVWNKSTSYRGGDREREKEKGERGRGEKEEVDRWIERQREYSTSAATGAILPQLGTQLPQLGALVSNLPQVAGVYRKLREFAASCGSLPQLGDALPQLGDVCRNWGMCAATGGTSAATGGTTATTGGCIAATCGKTAATGVIWISGGIWHLHASVDMTVPLVSLLTDFCCSDCSTPGGRW